MTRYTILRNKYFTNFEAAVLSNVPLDLPFMKELIREREYKGQEARDSGMSEGQFINKIKQEYIDNEFITPENKERGTKARINVWKMLRNREKKYKDQHPAYESPWKKRRRNWRDFVSKAERTMKRQNGMLFD